jgi:monoamine oxidase
MAHDQPPSVADAYANWIDAKPFSWSGPKPLLRAGVGPATRVRAVVPGARIPPEAPKPKIKVGIIGAGMSGLYAGLLFKKYDIPFHILEGRNDRVGGRVYTCREGFGPGDHQYFEAGAMRLPCIESQKPIFQLIEYLNDHRVAGMEQIELIKYRYKYEEGNLVYVNGKLMPLKYANQHPKELGYSLRPEDAAKTADKLMDEVMKDLLVEFGRNPNAFFKKYDHMSLRYYLGNCARPKWYPAKINYAETMTSGTNAFTYGLVESVIEHQDFNSPTNKWQTIKNGMSHLPEACAALIGTDNITMGAIVYKIEMTAKNKVALTYSKDGGVPSKNPKVVIFDKVLVAVPNPVLRMIERPHWSPKKEEAIRACNIQPCYKLGLQFKTRFWENAQMVDYPTYGGQSTTDTPSRWIVYPSYGIGDKGKGLLLTYCWSTDALSILPASDEQRKAIALRDLQLLYPRVDIQNEFTGKCKSVHWSAEWSSGVADFLPGQFTELYPALKEPEGRNPTGDPGDQLIYFAGEHISMRHGWIVGALDSAGKACKQMFPGINFELLCDSH